jgi:hypothetical protein
LWISLQYPAVKLSDRFKFRYLKLCFKTDARSNPCHCLASNAVPVPKDSDYYSCRPFSTFKKFCSCWCNASGCLMHPWFLSRLLPAIFVLGYYVLPRLYVFDAEHL